MKTLLIDQSIEATGGQKKMVKDLTQLQQGGAGRHVRLTGNGFDPSGRTFRTVCSQNVSS